MIKKYHKDIYFPIYAKEQAFNLIDTKYIDFSKHLFDNITSGEQNRGFTPKDVFNKWEDILGDRNRDLVEVEIESNKVIKAVYRTYLGGGKDIIIVFIRHDNSTVFVKTAWINYVNDKHKTLDYSKYEPKPVITIKIKRK
jgi:hypothetical protein